jgi:hypothetical protein
MNYSFRNLLKYSMVLLVFSTTINRSVLAQAPLAWPRAIEFDKGLEPTVAVTPSGRAVEFHTSERTNTIWYRLGRVDTLNAPNHYYVNWAKAQSLDYNGSKPSIAVTRDGYLVLVYTKHAYTGYGSEVQMRYWVGQFDLRGDDFTIRWKIKDAFYDTGRYAEISFNSSNVLVDVHESSRTSRLYYRIGHLRNPAAGQFDLVWDTGEGGRDYDKGMNASISVDDRNRVVEVHQTETRAPTLYYRRGQLNGNHITWASRDSSRYENDSKQPNVAFPSQDKIIEIANRNNAIFSRTGNLNVSDPARIDWSNATQIDSGSGFPGPGGSSVATNGNIAVATWENGGKLYYTITSIAQ